MRAVVLALLAACTSDPHVTDGTPFTFDIAATGHFEPRADPPTVFIDGVATTTMSTTYESRVAAEGVVHLVELRYADQVIASFPVPVSPMFCQRGTLTKVHQSVAVYDSGDLRSYGFAYQTDGGICAGEPARGPDCDCASDERCGLRVVRDEPRFTHLGCTPMGTKQVGEACSLTQDPGGAYDDCADNLICYQGTCHAPCQTTVCSTTCVQPDGYPTEATLCM
jgi:hypothetical protein